MERVRADLAAAAGTGRSVVMAHAFVTGGATSDSERDISVGGVAPCRPTSSPASTTPRSATCTGRSRSATTVRYSGSPVALSFCEADHAKGVLARRPVRATRCRVDLDRRARAARPCAGCAARSRSCWATRATAAAESAWCQVTLTDAIRPLGAMERVQQRFPHALVLQFEHAGVQVGATSYAARVRERDDLDLCCDFLEHVRGGAGATEQERAVLAEAVEGSRARPLAARGRGPGRHRVPGGVAAVGRVRLHRLEVTAFGPFAGTEEVDFDELAAAGLYLIHGATGAGKTSVLDAICFALYAAVPGARAESRRSLHSDHAPAGAVPEVVLELTAAGRRLRITRSPEFERPKLRGTGTTSVQAKVVLEELVRGEWVPRATRNDEAALVIHDVVGMGLEQFAKVVLLPQGDFAAFLRASPEQRREVLERLFDTQRFTDIEQWLADRRRAAVAAVADARAELEVALVRVQDVLAGLPASAAAAGAPVDRALRAPDRGSRRPSREWPGWADLMATDVPEAIERVRAAVAAHAGEALAAAELAQGRHDSAAADLQRARVLVEHQRTAAAARGVLRALADGRDAYDEAAGQVAAAERALAVGGHLAALEQAELDLTQALATVATRRRDAADRLPPATHPDLDAPGEVSRLLDLLEARQGPLDELGSCASTVTAQEAEAALARRSGGAARGPRGLHARPAGAAGGRARGRRGGAHRRPGPGRGRGGAPGRGDLPGARRHAARRAGPPARARGPPGRRPERAARRPQREPRRRRCPCAWHACTAWPVSSPAGSSTATPAPCAAPVSTPARPSRAPR